jgi:hypothetical protein
VKGDDKLRARFLSQQKIGAELLQGGDGRVPLSRAPTSDPGEFCRAGRLLGRNFQDTLKRGGTRHQNVDVVFRFAHDSPLEEGVYCELVSESEISEVSIPVRFWAILVS